jgi:hypothetical protein
MTAQRWILAALGIVVCLAMGRSASAKVIYADSQLKDDVTDGTYSVKDRGPGGHDGDAYRTIQGGVKAMAPGDTLLLRGGTFKERAISLRKKRGSAEAWFTLRSYPGEWAVVDGEHAEGPGGKTSSVFGVSPDAPAYWRFQWFEVTGGGPAWADADGVTPTTRVPKSGEHVDGCGFSFYPGDHLVFDHLYIHNNYQGIWSFEDENLTGAHDIVVTHCRLKDNSWPKDPTGETTQVSFAGDHNYFRRPINILTANTGNEVRYNLMEGSPVAYRDMYFQFLLRTHVGDDMAAKARGNRIHHNIIRGVQKRALVIKQDFSQVYNNIIDSDGAGMIIGNSPNTFTREPFHVVVYNNLFMTPADNPWRNAIFLNHGEDTGTVDVAKCNYPDGPGHPFCYFWNNIIERKGAAKSAVGINVKFDREKDPQKVDMSTVHIDNNYFYGWSPSDAAIQVGTRKDQFAVDQYLAKGWAKALYAAEAKPDNPLHEPGSPYKMRKEHTIGGTTLGKGGVSRPHPYLENVAIPGYVGPVDPDKDWTDDVLNLRKLGTEMKAPITTPESEGSPR